MRTMRLLLSAAFLTVLLAGPVAADPICIPNGDLECRACEIEKPYFIPRCTG